MNQADIERVYKSASHDSHTAGLLAVFNAGRASAAPDLPATIDGPFGPDAPFVDTTPGAAKDQLIKDLEAKVMQQGSIIEHLELLVAKDRTMSEPVGLGGATAELVETAGSVTPTGQDTAEGSVTPTGQDTPPAGSADHHSV